MAYGSSMMTAPKAPKKKAPSVKSTKPKSKAVKGISPAQEKKLKEHSKHHSPKHISMMRKDMKNGMSFTNAHNKAQKAVGK